MFEGKAGVVVGSGCCRYSGHLSLPGLEAGTHAVSGEGLLLGSQTAVFSLRPLMEESKRSKLPAVAS